MNQSKIQAAVILFTCFSFLCFSCQVSRVNKVFSMEYAHSQASQRLPKNDYINIRSDGFINTYQAYITETPNGKKESMFFYVKKKRTGIYMLNPKIPVMSFTNAISNYAAKSIKQKLNGGKLELTIDSIPNIFIIIDKNTGIAALIENEVAIIESCPCNKYMAISYRLLNDTGAVKKGNILIPATPIHVSIKNFQFIEKAMLEYSDLYQAGIGTMSKHFIDKLLPELNTAL